MHLPKQQNKKKRTIPFRRIFWHSRPAALPWWTVSELHRKCSNQSLLCFCDTCTLFRGRVLAQRTRRVFVEEVVILLAGIGGFSKFNLDSFFTCEQRKHERPNRQIHISGSGEAFWPVRYFSLALARSSASKYHTVMAYLQTVQTRTVRAHGSTEGEWRRRNGTLTS